MLCEVVERSRWLSRTQANPGVAYCRADRSVSVVLFINPNLPKSSPSIFLQISQSLGCSKSLDHAKTFQALI